MKADKGERQILLVGDSADELRSVLDLLDSGLGGCMSTADEAEAMQWFEQKHPLVLILAFLEIEKAERFYLTLFRQCGHIADIPHQTLVLCKNTEAELAYSLCVHGTVDDYVVSRPLYDPYRLRLSVRQALDRRASRQDARALNRQLADVGKDVHRLDNEAAGALAVGSQRQQETLRVFTEFNQHLGSHLNQLERTLTDPALLGTLAESERRLLTQKVEQVRHKLIEPEAQRMHSRLQETAAWLSQVSERYERHAQSLRARPFPEPPIDVLAVDDDVMYLAMLTAMLDGAQMRVTAIDDAGAALTELRRWRPDVVLLDYQMPGYDGLEILRRIKSDADQDVRALPVLMLTANSERELVARSIQGGAADFIVKPSDRATIRAKLAHVLPEDLRARVLSESAAAP